MLAGSDTRSRVKAIASAAAPSARCASLRRVRGLGRHRDRGERRLLFGFFGGAVLVEAVGAQRGAESELGGGLGRRHPGVAVAEIDRESRLAFAGAVQMRDEIAAEILQQPRIDRVRLAETGDDDAAQRQVRRPDQRQQLVLLAVEAGRRGDGPADRAAGLLVEPPRRRGQDPVLPHADDDGARLNAGGQREFREIDLHRATPGKRIKACPRDRRVADASQCR